MTNVATAELARVQRASVRAMHGRALRRRLATDLAVGLVVALIAMGVIYWQAATADPQSSTGHAFRLVCPLH